MSRSVAVLLAMQVSPVSCVHLGTIVTSQDPGLDYAAKIVNHVVLALTEILHVFLANLAHVLLLILPTSLVALVTWTQMDSQLVIALKAMLDADARSVQQVTKATRSYQATHAHKVIVMLQEVCHLNLIHPVATVFVRTTPLDQRATNASRTLSTWTQAISSVVFSASAAV